MKADPVSVLDFFHSTPLRDAERVLDMAKTLVQARRKRQPTYATAPPPDLGEAAGDGIAWPITQKAVAVLEGHGNPMNGPDLTAAINARFGSDHTRDSVVGALARSSNNGGPLSRASKGLYGLRKWEEEVQPTG